MHAARVLSGVGTRMAAEQRNNPLAIVIVATLSLSIAAGIVAILIAGWGYYASPTEARMLSAERHVFSSAGLVGLGCGLAATVLFLSNLFYLVRRRYAFLAMLGSLRGWLSWHVLSGLLGAGLVALHAVFEARSHVGRALVWSLGIAIGTGLLGRYMVRFIPRNRKGERMSLAALQEDVLYFADTIRPALIGDAQAIQVLQRMADAVQPDRQRAEPTLAQSMGQLRAVRREMGVLRHCVQERGSAADQRRGKRLVASASRLYRQIVMAQAVGRLLDSWRTFHRVLALLFLAALATHIGAAIYYGFARI